MKAVVATPEYGSVQTLPLQAGIVTGMTSRQTDLDDSPCERGFEALRLAYAPTGGVARAEDLAHMLDDLCRGDFISLARHIGRGDVFALPWRDELWVPMFQFDLADLSLRTGPLRVRAELAGALEGWDLATWFARPNTWLDGHRPADCLDARLATVLDAARADRFIATH